MKNQGKKEFCSTKEIESVNRLTKINYEKNSFYDVYIFTKCNQTRSQNTEH